MDFIFVTCEVKGIICGQPATPLSGGNGGSTAKEHIAEISRVSRTIAPTTIFARSGF
jgi:hypothetical protein